jgi:hypothetical protein
MRVLLRCTPTDQSLAAISAFANKSNDATICYQCLKATADHQYSLLSQSAPDRRRDGGGWRDRTLMRLDMSGLLHLTLEDVMVARPAAARRPGEHLPT